MQLVHRWPAGSVLGSFGHGRSLLPVCRSRSQFVALPQRGPLPPEVLSSPAWPLGVCGGTKLPIKLFEVTQKIRHCHASGSRRACYSGFIIFIIIFIISQDSGRVLTRTLGEYFSGGDPVSFSQIDHHGPSLTYTSATPTSRASPTRTSDHRWPC